MDLSPLDHLQEAISGLRQTVNEDERILIALAGIPGSGKSTVAAALLEQLRHTGINDVAVVPMDGYHYTKARLAVFDDPDEAFRRRGAPFTYDADAFVAAVQQISRIKVSKEAKAAGEVRLPGFDHAAQDPTDDAIVLSSDIKVVILEGNYTLLDIPPWNKIASLAHEKWFVDIPRATAKQRIVRRHILAGIESTQEAAEARAEENDLPNGDLIVAKLIKPDRIITC